MAPLQPRASPSTSTSTSTSTSPQFNSKNLRRGLLQHQQEGAGASSAGKRLGSNHLPPERSASFHGRSTNAAAASAQLHQKQQMRRPKTQPDLIAAAGDRSKNLLRTGNFNSGEKTREVPVPAKVLVSVNVQRSLGALQVMASTEWTVDQLVAAAVKQYVKEGRRPLLPTTDPSAFGLHYSQFSLECLEPKEKLIGLGSRNFFLCPMTKAKTVTVSPFPASAAIHPAASASESTASSSSTFCSEEAEKASVTAQIFGPQTRPKNFSPSPPRPTLW